MNAKVNQNSLSILKCNNYEEYQCSILKQGACFNYKFAGRVMRIFILSFTQINQKFLKIWNFQFYNLTTPQWGEEKVGNKKHDRLVATILTKI